MSKNNSLVSLVNESNNLELMLIESGGEMTPEIEQALAINEKGLLEKVDRCAFVLERLEAMEDFYKQKADYFSKISSQVKNAQVRMKDNLKIVMDTMNVEELVGQEVRFKKVPTAGKLNIIDETLIPAEFKKTVAVIEIDKKSLKDAALKYEVPGAEFVPGFSVRTYANTKAVK
jgi:hypothetical protein